MKILRDRLDLLASCVVRSDTYHSFAEGDDLAIGVPLDLAAAIGPP